MKKNAIFFVAIITIATGIVLSCSKSDTKSVQKKEPVEQLPSSQLTKASSETIAEISSNENFITLIDDLFDFANYFKNVVIENKLDLRNLQENFADLVAKNLPFEEQIEEINKIMKEDVKERLVNHVEVFSKNWAIIIGEYPEITQKELEAAILERVAEVDIPCRWMYYICLAGATAASVLCAAGCTAATVGLGAPACVALCVTIHVSATLMCVDSYCKK